jgi:nitroreductase
MKALENDALIRQLNWRYATKKFDPTRKIPQGDWNTLEQALILAPSSSGLQPWKFFVVTQPDVRAKLRLGAFNQPQITDASHLVVLAARKDFGAPDIDRHIARIAELRSLAPSSLEGLRKSMLGLVQKPQEQIDAWVARQVYIALGTFLTTAAVLGIDACPMEGFDRAQFDQVLSLPEKGYFATVLAAAGYRAEDDAYARLPKVRFAVEDVISRIA